MIHRFIIISLLCVLTTASTSFADDAQEISTPLVSRNQIIKLEARGIDPKVLNMSVSDSIVFFLNDSPTDLATLQIDYGSHPTHCASSNLLIGEGGTVRSQRPFGYKDFASLCFHEAGDYPFTIYGLKVHPDGVRGTIRVSADDIAANTHQDGGL